MRLGKLLEYLVARRRVLSWLMLTIMAVLVVLDIVLPSHYDRFPWEGIGGFGAIYGFLACTIIVVVSKALGSALLNRPEDYYDD